MFQIIGWKKFEPRDSVQCLLYVKNFSESLTLINTGWICFIISCLLRIRKIECFIIRTVNKPNVISYLNSHRKPIFFVSHQYINRFDKVNLLLVSTRKCWGGQRRNWQEYKGRETEANKMINALTKAD